MPPREREVIELSLRHNLHDDELAEALEVSGSRAHALTERARGRLEKSLGALLVARIGAQACPELGTLLSDWDGRLTEEARDLIAGHIEQCPTCAGRRQARCGRRPCPACSRWSRSPGLREQVLKLCSSATPDVVAYRQHATRRAESVWRTRVSQVITMMRWGSSRAHPGRAVAAVVVVIWAVAAVSFTMLTFAGAHSARALTARVGVSSPTASPTALATPTAAPAVVSRSASAKASARGTRSQTIAPPPVQSLPASAVSSPTPSSKPSPSRSPKPSKSSSPKPSKSPSPSPSSSSASASPSPAA